MKRRGFTYIELLVVISIIGLMSVMAVVSNSRIQARNRDLKRIQDFQLISNALERYYSDHGDYPHNPPTIAVSDSALSGIDETLYGGFLSELKPYFAGGILPVDPINEICVRNPIECDSPGDWWFHQSYRYEYIWYNPSISPSGSQCGGTDYYTLSTPLEVIKEGDPQYSSCVCPFTRLAAFSPRADWPTDENDCDGLEACPEEAPLEMCGTTYRCCENLKRQWVTCNPLNPGTWGTNVYSICGFRHNTPDNP